MRKKKNPAKKSEESQLVKGLGLFDHVKHIQRVQDPNYFRGLTELDQKSFAPFTILKALSMNPEFLDCAAEVFKYFDIIPKEQLYTLLIQIYPLDRTFYPWIKSKKKLRYAKKIYELVQRKYEVSFDEAEAYVELYSLNEKGIKQLRILVQGFGVSEKEIDKLMAGKDDEENE